MNSHAQKRVALVPHAGLRGAVRWVFVVLQFLAGALCSAAPEVLPGAGAPMLSGESYPSPTYSWFVLPALGGRGFVLAHLPPRSADEQGVHEAQDGVYRSAIRLEDKPEALAAWGDAVFAVFAPKHEAGPNSNLSGRSVFTLRAKRYADSELWVDEPAGRMETLPGLPGAAGLWGFTAIDSGPCALYFDTVLAKVRLVLLDRDWRVIELPAELNGAKLQARLGLAGDASGLLLLSRKADEWVVWRGDPKVERSGGETRITCQWVRSTIRVEELQNIDPDAQILHVNGHWYGVQETKPGTLSVKEVGESGVRLVAEIQDSALRRAVVPMDGLARLIVISASEPLSAPDSGPAPSRPTGASIKVTEISLLSGRVLFAGPARTVNPLGSSQFRLIAVGLILAMAFILVLVIRSDEAPEPHLPDGYSLAEPMRRAIAGAMDFAIVSLLVPRLTGNSVLELLGPSAWLDGEAYQTLVLIAGLGFIIGTVGEYFFGRSPGKLLTDCEVISIVPQAPTPDGKLPRPSLVGCLVRNGIKWFLAPVAVLALMDSTGRHRGDQIARSAVVVRFDPNDEEQDLFGED